ncbi:MAG: glycosyltransferase family 2 protein [Candidatus Aenigmarchaeota archaeon]|nr:glycosyltransferase family 2 protein [Candidatus Aenigmarchaeota archaeon]
MKISIIVPAHNEERIIGKTLQYLSKTLKKSVLNHEIVVVDDNSDDNTLAIMKKISNFDKRIHVLNKISNKPGPTGLGSAIKFGILHASGDVLIPFMGDLSDDPNDIIKLVEKIEEGYDIVCGSRFIEGGKVVGYPFIKLIAHRIYNKFFSFVFGLGLEDFSNAFKAYRKNIFNSIEIESKGFEFNAEVLLKAHILAYKITEVPVKWYRRKEGMSKLGSFSPTLGFIFLRLPRIGWRYGKITIKLYFKFLLSKIRKLSKL